MDDPLHVYYDYDANPITLQEWAQLNREKWRGEEPGIVGRTKVGGLLVSTVSTVWLGMNHAFDPAAPPLIYETMVFNETKDGLDRFDDLACERYTTREQAEAGHAAMVAKVMNGEIQ